MEVIAEEATTGNLGKFGPHEGNSRYKAPSIAEGPVETEDGQGTGEVARGESENNSERLTYWRGDLP